MFMKINCVFFYYMKKDNSCEKFEHFNMLK